MIDRQIKLVETVKRHLAQEIPLEQMHVWLMEHIKPAIFDLAAYHRPAMWLEMYAYRTLRNHLDDLLDQTISKTSLEWYWEEVEHVLNLLVGNEVYKRTEFQVGYPLNDSFRRRDRWMLPYLERIEEAMHQLDPADLDEVPELSMSVLGLDFELPPPPSRTCSEFILGEVLNMFEQYEDAADHLAYHPPDNYYSAELKFTLLQQLKRLLSCLKGEQGYSVSVTFEGLDKFAVAIIVS